MRSPFLKSCVALFLVACGGGTASSPEPNTAASEDDRESVPQSAQISEERESASTPNGPLAIPSACHRDEGICTADPKWVKKLCAEAHPDVALVLFSPSSPFTRGYLTGKTKVVSAAGGLASEDEFLAFDEEVVLLIEKRPSASGIQISGDEGGFDAIRWDGSCVSLDASAVTTRKAPNPKRSRIDWRALGEDMQEALKSIPEVRDAFVARKQECKGAYSGEVSKKCVQRDDALMQAIVKAVSSGSADLPVPNKRP